MKQQFREKGIFNTLHVEKTFEEDLKDELNKLELSEK